MTSDRLKTAKRLLLTGPLMDAFLNQQPDVWPPVPIDPSKPMKSVTRRVCKDQPVDLPENELEAGMVRFGLGGLEKLCESKEPGAADAGFLDAKPYTCPYGTEGQLLYIAEPYKIDIEGQLIIKMVHGHYLRDGEGFSVELTEQEYDLWTAREYPYRKTSGRYMYKSLARHFAIVKRVGCSELQTITEAQAIAEGVERLTDAYTGEPSLWRDYNGAGPGYRTATSSFRSLWQSINSKRPSCSYYDAPHVWDISIMRTLLEGKKP